ncbi:MAG: hypothetical protein K0R22_20 [Sporomusa sp.]|nr:hypothetical protein [Sporomusa sp.]
MSDTNNVLSDKFSRLVVYDEANSKEIAVITSEQVITANPSIVVKLTPTKI